MSSDPNERFFMAIFPWRHQFSVRLHIVPAPIPVDTICGAPTHHLLRGALLRGTPPPRRPARVPTGERTRLGDRRRVRHGLGDSVGVLPDAARLRAPLREVQRDLERVLRRRLQVRAAHREARHAVSHHGLVSVLRASHVQYRVPGSVWLCA